MKKILFFSVMSTVVILMSACTAKPETASALLKNEVMQDSVMTIISSDHQLMNKMMTYMMQNQHSMQMMIQNNEMMQNMMTMADKDSAMCRLMMNKMMEHPNMKGMMMDMMNKKGMTDQKDMMNGNKVPDKNKEDHESHH